MPILYIWSSASRAPSLALGRPCKGWPDLGESDDGDIDRMMTMEGIEGMEEA